MANWAGPNPRLAPLFFLSPCFLSFIFGATPRSVAGDQPSADSCRRPPPLLHFLLPSLSLFLSFFLFLLPCYSSSSLGNGKAGRGGRPNPTGCLLGTGGSRRSRLRPDEPAGTPLGLNQAVTSLVPQQREGRPAALHRSTPVASSGRALHLSLSDRLKRPGTPQPRSITGGAAAAPFDLPLCLSISLSMRQRKGGRAYQCGLIATDGGRRLLSPSPFIVEEESGEGRGGTPVRRPHVAREYGRYRAMPLFFSSFFIYLSRGGLQTNTKKFNKKMIKKKYRKYFNVN